MKKSLTITMIMILIIALLGGVVNAASANIKTSSSSVNKGDTVTITVSFGQKVSAVQFSLNFDSSKLEYVSKSGGGSFSPDTKRYGYYSEDAVVEDLSSVSFKFKAKATGNTSVSVSGLKISAGSETGVLASMGKSSVSINIKEKSTTTTKKPTTNNTNKNTNTKPKEEETVTQEPAPNKIIKLDDNNVKTLENDENNIMIKYIQTAIEDGVKLEVKEIKDDAENYKTLDHILRYITGEKLYFDISLLKEDVKVQPNGYVTVCIPIPEDYTEDSIEVYYLDEESKKYELIEGEIQTLKKEVVQNKNQKKEIEEKYYTFTTNHFSIYTLIGEQEQTQVVAPVEIENEEKQNNDVLSMIIEFFKNNIVLYVVIGFLILIAIIQRIRISGLKD